MELQVHVGLAVIKHDDFEGAAPAVINGHVAGAFYN